MGTSCCRPLQLCPIALQVQQPPLQVVGQLLPPHLGGKLGPRRQQRRMGLLHRRALRKDRQRILCSGEGGVGTGRVQGRAGVQAHP